MSEKHRPSYVSLVAALRSEFNDLQLEALKIQLEHNRYSRSSRSSLGVLWQAIHDAHDVTYDPGENVHPAVREWFAGGTR